MLYSIRPIYHFIIWSKMIHRCYILLDCHQNYCALFTYMYPVILTLHGWQSPLNIGNMEKSCVVKTASIV